MRTFEKVKNRIQTVLDDISFELIEKCMKHCGYSQFDKSTYYENPPLVVDEGDEEDEEDVNSVEAASEEDENIAATANLKDDGDYATDNDDNTNAKADVATTGDATTVTEEDMF